MCGLISAHVWYFVAIGGLTGRLQFDSPEAFSSLPPFTSGATFSMFNTEIFSNDKSCAQLIVNFDLVISKESYNDRLKVLVGE